MLLLILHEDRDSGFEIFRCAVQPSNLTFGVTDVKPRGTHARLLGQKSSNHSEIMVQAISTSLDQSVSQRSLYD